MSKSFMNGKRFTGAVVALLASAVLSVNAYAGECTIENWDSSPGLGASDVGSPSEGFKRYTRSCSLKVAFGGESGAWVENSTDMNGNPFSEPRYIARFYGFFDDLIGEDIYFFEAFDGEGESVFAVTFSATSGTDSGVFKINATGGERSLSTSFDAKRGWNSIEVDYESGSLVAIINGEEVASFGNASVRNVEMVQLGDIDGRGIGHAFFDEFDSRRGDRPGRLVAGDATESGSVDVDDAVAVIDEFMGRSLATGQPDCNEDGAVDVDDFVCAIDKFMGRR